MSAIPFTDRELRRAWRELSLAAKSSDQLKNPQRLLLFYAVECGLKAVWLKRKSRSLFSGEDIHQMGHNLQRVLKELAVGSSLTLPEHFELDPIVDRSKMISRTAKFGDIHQAWRYGGACRTPTDECCEDHLSKILNWIQGELK